LFLSMRDCLLLGKDVVAPPEIDRRVSKREIAIEAARHPGSSGQPHLVAARAAAHRSGDGVGGIIFALRGDVRIGRVYWGAPHPVCPCRPGKGGETRARGKGYRGEVSSLHDSDIPPSQSRVEHKPRGRELKGSCWGTFAAFRAFLARGGRSS